MIPVRKPFCLCLSLLASCLCSGIAADAQSAANPGDQDRFLLYQEWVATTRPGAQTRATPPGDKVYAIRAARLIDGRSDNATVDAVVVVRNGIIVAVGPRGSVQVPEGAEMIDLGDSTVLPGFIDGHTHSSGRADSTGVAGQRVLWQQDNGIQMARAIRHARLNLLSGVTTSRVAGDPAHLDFYLRDAINQGLVPGPRVLPSGQWVSTTTGGTIRSRRVNGPWDIIRLVRNNVEDGATQIKVIIYGKTPTSTNVTTEELRAAVDDAHREGKIVTAHATDEAGMKQAISVGVDNIEHGSTLTDEIIGSLAAKHIAVDSTEMAGYQLFFDEGWPYQDKQSTAVADWTAWMRALMKKVDAESSDRQKALANRRAAVAKAHRAGVPFFVGLDNFHGLISLEMEFLVGCGFTPMEAIKAGTAAAAKAIGLGEKTGTLEPGKWADIIAVKGNPLEQFGQLSSVDFIMVGGRRYDGLSYR